MRDRNVVIRTEHYRPQDIDLLFGPLEPEDVIEVFEAGETSWARLLVGQGTFSSTSQARKAGFADFPPGWTDRMVGKAGRTRWCIWNPEGE